MNNASLELGGTNWAEKDGNILGYSVGDTSGKYSPQEFTFARGSNLSATRIDRAGLIVKGRENVVTYSNDFSNSAWAKYLISSTSGQSGYDGTLDAWLIERSGAFGNVYRNLSISGVFTWSVYAKAGSYDFLALRYRNASNQYRSAFFDLSNGTLGSVDTNLIKHTIEDVGGGWYRCSIVFNDSAANQVMIYPSDVNNGIGNSGTGNILIQDAQLEQGLAASPYIPTTTTTAQAGVLENTPRLNYTTGVANPYLLLEPSRTNVMANSEYFGGYNIAQMSLEYNYAVSPEGVQNATRLIENTAAGTAHSVSIATATNGTEYALSVYAKPNGRDFIYMYVGGGPGTGTIINIVNGIKGNNIGNAPNDTIIEPVGNGWFRCTILFNSIAGSPTPTIGLANSLTSFTYTGDGTSGVLIYGIQLEAGSYPTSYIPTYSVSATRAQDVCNKADASGEINSTEGVFYLEISALADSGTNRFIIINDSTTSNRLSFRYRTNSNLLSFEVHIGGVLKLTLNYTLVDTTITQKLAFKFKQNDYALWVNGVERGISQLSEIWSANTLNSIDFTGFNQPFEGKVNALQLYKEALTDAELATLTTI